MFAGDDEAADAADRPGSRRIADRFGDPDLRMLAGTGRGQALIALGRIAEGIELPGRGHGRGDGRLRCLPTVAGLIYCAVI